MRWWKISAVMYAVFLCCIFSPSYTQDHIPQSTDTSQIRQPVYDPFGPENSPDHNGRGSGGVITPSPYEDVIQTYYTSISADYNGIQYMLDCPWMISPGMSWSSEESDIFGILFKVQSTGFKISYYDPVLEDTIHRYRFPVELSFDYSLNDKIFQAVKFRVHWETYTKSLGMAGIGVLVSNWNLMIARDLAMDREWDIEATWIQVAGGYIMPLSPKVGGLNIAICGALDLFGAKHQTYKTDNKKFYGAKIGSVGWLAGFGWNAVSFLNLSLYAGGEWSFSTGGLELPTSKIVSSSIGRGTLYFGMQLTGRYFNFIGGIQKEREYIDYLKTIQTEENLHYYLGANYYFRR